MLRSADVMEHFDSLSYPPHDGDGHRITESGVTRTVRTLVCWLAAIRNHRIPVGKSHQAFALGGRESADCCAAHHGGVACGRFLEGVGASSYSKCLACALVPSESTYRMPVGGVEGVTRISDYTETVWPVEVLPAYQFAVNTDQPVPDTVAGFCSPAALALSFESWGEVGDIRIAF